MKKEKAVSSLKESRNASFFSYSSVNPSHIHTMKYEMKIHYISSLPPVGMANTHTHSNNIKIESLNFNDRTFVKAEL